MVSSSVLVLTPSLRKYAVSVGIISIVARRMMPVRPLPPTVAQNSFAFFFGEMVCTWPSAVSRSMERTWLPKLPSE